MQILVIASSARGFTTHQADTPGLVRAYRNQPQDQNEKAQWEAVPLAPRGAPGPILQDRNMALTWSIGASGRIRTRVPLLRSPRYPLRGCPAGMKIGVWLPADVECA